MSKITLIDGYSIVHRAFYGLPDMTNAAGTHTNAVFGFLNILFRILSEENPDYLVVALDAHAPTFRNEIYKEYKGTRKPMPNELREQLPILREVLSSMNILTVEKPGLEADDILGTLGKRCEAAGVEVTIVSGDRDLLQLSSDTLKVRIPKTKPGGTQIEDYNTAEVIEKFSVPPIRIIDLKALMGDASDNIPGVPSIGEKTATKLLVEYGSVDGIYEHLDEVKPDRARKALEEHRDMCELSRTLATICTDGDIEFDLESARLGQFYNPASYALFKQLDFNKFLANFDSKCMNTECKATHEIISSGEAFAQIIEAIDANRDIAVSLAPDGSGLAVAYEESLYYLTSEIDIKEALNDLVAGTGRLYCCNFKNSMHIYRDVIGGKTDSGNIEALLMNTAGINSMCITGEGSFMSPRPVRDVIIGAYLLNPLKNDYKYNDLAQQYLQENLRSAAEIMGKSPFDKISIEDKAVLCCSEAYAALKTGGIIENKLSECGMNKLYEDVEMPLSVVLFDMECKGIRVKEEELKAYGEELQKNIDILSGRIYEEAGEEFNIQSPKQLGVILFEKLHLPAGKKTKTGYSTAADVLEKLAQDYTIVKDILEYRTLTKLKSTYADGLVGYIAGDGRIHGTFNQTVTATGRISSTEPNLQNIPVRMDLGRQIRKIFVPVDGWSFTDADYSQVELRILASLSEDENLIRAYNEAADIHRMTAAQVFGKAYDEVTESDRRNAKAVNFGIVYGISSFGLGQDLNISRKEAQQYIEAYFRTYPGVKKYLDDTVAQAKETGSVSTYFGRIRPVPELSSGNFMERSFGERVAMNSPIQGTAADIMKIAMISVWKEFVKQNLKSVLVLQIHDELLVETCPGEEEQVAKILKSCMENAAELAVKLEADVKTGNNWMEAH